MTDHSKSPERVALVTGASSGIGRAIASLLAARGYRTFGTSRKPASVHPPAGVEMVGLDLTSDESAAVCVASAVARSGRLDVLVNNAGQMLRGALEEVSVDQAREVFDVNFFGPVRMMKAALPVMREQGGGYLVNVTSMAVVTPVPFRSAYSASKAALESLSESLRHELRPLGIRVSVVEPMYIRTDLMEHAVEAERSLRAYAAGRDQVMASARRSMSSASEPELVAQTVLRILADPSPRLRHRVGRHAGLQAGLRRLLPDPAFEWLMRRYLGLD